MPPSIFDNGPFDRQFINPPLQLIAGLGRCLVANGSPRPRPCFPAESRKSAHDFYGNMGPHVNTCRLARTRTWALLSPNRYPITLRRPSSQSRWRWGTVSALAAT